VIFPDCGFKKDAAKPAIVDFPEPEVPTKAVMDPFSALKDI
jgi:hypothetical protein